MSNYNAHVLSIVVPVYNAQDFIKECLESIQHQDFLEWECLCVDDGSTDRSSEIIQEFCRKDARFKYYRQNNSGVANARTKGLALSSGRYIGWVDSDDFIKPNHFAELIEAIVNSGDDIVCSSVLHCDSSGSNLRKANAVTDPVKLAMGIYAMTASSSLWGKLFRRDIIEKSGANMGAGACVIMEDAYFLLGYLRVCNSVGYIDSASYVHCVRNPQSLSCSCGNSQWWRNYIMANEAIYELVRPWFDKDVVRTRINKVKLDLLYAPEVSDKVFRSYHPEVVLPWVNNYSLVQKGDAIIASIGLRQQLLRAKSCFRRLFK